MVCIAQWFASSLNAVPWRLPKMVAWIFLLLEYAVAHSGLQLYHSLFHQSLTDRRLGCMHCLVAQSCETLWDPIDCNTPGSSVHGISQTRILEWVAISFSSGSSQLLHWKKDSLPLSHLGSPWVEFTFSLVQMVKNQPVMWETWVDPWVSKIP